MMDQLPGRSKKLRRSCRWACALPWARANQKDGRSSPPTSYAYGQRGAYTSSYRRGWCSVGARQARWKKRSCTPREDVESGPAQWAYHRGRCVQSWTCARGIRRTCVLRRPGRPRGRDGAHWTSSYASPLPLPRSRACMPSSCRSSQVSPSSVPNGPSSRVAWGTNWVPLPHAPSLG